MKIIDRIRERFSIHDNELIEFEKEKDEQRLHPPLVIQHFHKPCEWVFYKILPLSLGTFETILYLCDIIIILQVYGELPDQ